MKVFFNNKFRSSHVNGNLKENRGFSLPGFLLLHGRGGLGVTG